MAQQSRQVTTNGFTVHAMDALAISPMFTLPSTIMSNCNINKSTVYINQTGLFFQNEPEMHDVYVVIDWNAASSGSMLYQQHLHRNDLY